MNNSTKTLLLGAVAAAAIGGYVVHKKSYKGKEKHAKEEKCYGAALKGENACKSANGSHSCAGWAPKDCDSNEWTLVKKGTCDTARKECLKKAERRDKEFHHHPSGSKSPKHKKH